MAVCDLVGQDTGLPLWKLLGGARDRIAAGMTIGILPDDETVEQAHRWRSEGFHFLKLKGGLNVLDDVERVRKVRKALGPDVWLAFDANGGYSVGEAVQFAQQTASANLEFLEQPTPRELTAGLGEVQRQVTLPVMADESLTTIPQALELASAGQVRLFNIKLMKVGGFHPAFAIANIAEGSGIGLMIGCLDESALGIAAGLHFALARPGVVYADLDAHFALTGDPFAGAVICRDGFLHASERPGLGVSLD